MSNLLPFRKHAFMIIALATILLGGVLTSSSPIKTVKGLLTDVGFSPAGAMLSIDSGRVAFEDSGQHTFYVYDINSGTNTSFAGPNGLGFSYGPAIYGDKLIAAGNITALNQFGTISYCVLPHTVPLQPCGPWKLLVKNVGGANNFIGYGLPVIHGDLSEWWVVNGVQYHRFSSNITETDMFPSPAQPVELSTNGEIVAFTLANNPALNNCGYIYYVDTTNETQGPVNTGMYNCARGARNGISISQSTIAFADNSSGSNRIRYFDYLQNQASPAGTGPLGNLTFTNSPAIWGNRIVFTASETAVGFDCDGDGRTLGSQLCLMYWNIRAPSFVATTLAGQASPPLGSATVAIYDNLIAFVGTNSHLQYVKVPMQGDVNQDGVVDGNDKTLVNNCVGKVLKGSVC